jgi:OmpR family response regulator RpaB
MAQYAVAERPGSERILVVDDEQRIRSLIETRLQLRGYCVTLAGDGEEAVESFQRQPADLVVLDLMLPRLDGYGVLEAVRAVSDVPVLMLTACDRVEDRILGLELGADDYLVKPFSLTELEARIRCVLRRVQQSAQKPPTSSSAPGSLALEISGLTIHLGKRQVFRGAERIKLTAMEFSLLELLVGKAGESISRMKILEAIWGYTPDRHADTRVVDVHVARLRLKLELDAKNPELILTARGLGYQFQRLPATAG